MSCERFSERYLIHGLAVELACQCPSIVADLEHMLGPFAESAWPEGFAAIGGTIQPYDSTEVIRHLSSDAHPVEDAAGGMELYQDGERFWLVDDRWGICEINVLKSQWRSWLLPQPQLDAFQCVEMAVLWPMAQLLRNRGLHLIPSAAVVARDGWAGLILARGEIGRELAMLADEGFGIVSQRWTALREEDGRLSMLHLPGMVEHTPSARRLGVAHQNMPRWIDLMALRPETYQHHAFCDGVLMIEPGRRPRSHIGEASPVNAIYALRRHWPIVELQPGHRRNGQMAARLAQLCRCYEVQLSRDPRDLSQMIHSIQSLDLTPWMQTPASMTISPPFVGSRTPMARAS